MPKLPRYTGKEMIALLVKRGFSIARIRGSHHVLVKGELHTTVPVHGNGLLRIGTLRGILRDTKILPEEL